MSDESTEIPCASRQVGDVATNYHAVSLRIKSVLDSTNAELDNDIGHEGRDSTVAGAETTDDESQVFGHLLSCL